MAEESIWKISSVNPGPTVMVIGGMHGNELTGIDVVQRLVGCIDTIQRGELILALGNPRAIELGRRGSRDHVDLNRIFTSEKLSGMDRSLYEFTRAQELLPYLNTADVLVDLHSTNKPSRQFSVAMSGDQRHMDVASYFPAPDILTYPNALIPGTAIGHVAARGGVGIAYESGHASDRAGTEETFRAVTEYLRAVGIFAEEGTRLQASMRRFHVETDVRLTEQGFMFAEGRGRSSFEPFTEGDILGWRGQESILAPFDGVMMFPKVPDLWQLNKPVMSLARKMTDAQVGAGAEGATHSG